MSFWILDYIREARNYRRMKLYSFNSKIDSIRISLIHEYMHMGRTSGLCSHISECIGHCAMLYFESRFSPKNGISRLFWLGDLDTPQGLARRLEVLKKFKDLVTKEKKYLEWV